MTRRSMFAALLMAAGLPLDKAAARDLPSPRAASRDALRRVDRWGCQYQSVDVAAIAGSDLDLVVVDPSLDDDSLRFLSPADCRMLKTKPDGGRRIVLAYLCVGEIDTKRWFWPAQWRISPPRWLGAENARWPGSHSVEYWAEDWRDLLFDGKDSLLGRIIATGFDGVLLDRVDGYQDWEAVYRDAREDMAELVMDLARKARVSDPGFMLMLQNAETLLIDDHLLEAVDAHNKESLLTGLVDRNGLNSPQDVEWSLQFLRHLQVLGIPTFATDYSDDATIREQVRERLLSLGFVPFFGAPALDRLPDPLPARS